VAPLMEALVDEPVTENGRVFSGTWYSKDIPVKRVAHTVDRSHLSEPNAITIQVGLAFREIMMNIDCRHPATVPFVGWNYDRARIS
jgi:hypothetical protein